MPLDAVNSIGIGLRRVLEDPIAAHTVRISYADICSLLKEIYDSLEPFVEVYDVVITGPHEAELVVKKMVNPARYEILAIATRRGCDWVEEAYLQQSKQVPKEPPRIKRIISGK